MKNRTRRQLGLWMGNRLAVSSGVVTIVGSLTSTLIVIAGENRKEAIATELATVLIAGLLAWLAIKRDAASENKYFSSIVFDSLDTDRAREVADNIAEGASATPEFSAIAPEPDELQSVLDELSFTRIAYISGGPGEGKSILAYHAARKFEKDGYKAYQLSGTFLSGLSRQYMRETLLTQTDSLKGPARLIIVDDAHLLERPNDVEDIFMRVLADNDTSLIWIWTDEARESAAAKATYPVIRINYAQLAPKLSAFFTGSRYQGATASPPASILEANRLSDSGTITTAWQYSFAAFDGSRRLASTIDKLTNLQLLSLFILSAHSVATGDIRIAFSKAQSMLDSISIGWVRDDLRDQSFAEALHSLSRRAVDHVPLLRTQASSLALEIACLHYNFAREVTRGGVRRTGIADDLVKGLAGVLVAQGEYFRYLGLLCLDLGSFLGALVIDADKFLRECIVGSTLTHTAAVARLLDALIRQRFDSRVEQFLAHLDAMPLAVRISQCSVAEFAGAAGIIRYSRALASFNEQLILMLDVGALAETAKHVHANEFSALAYLLRELDERRTELADDLDLNALSIEASHAHAAEFESKHSGPRLMAVLS